MKTTRCLPRMYCRCHPIDSGSGFHGPTSGSKPGPVKETSDVTVESRSGREASATPANAPNSCANAMEKGIA